MILHSQIIGEGNPFIILHGFLGMSDNWKTLGRKFSELGYQMHLIDQRNHGKSFQDTSFNYKVLSEDIIKYCDHFNLESPHLLGHSMGGKTAMYFASQYPEKINKLIIADISPKAYPPHHQDILKALQSLDFNILKSRTEAEKVLSQYIKEKGVIQFLLKNLYWVEKGKLGLRINLESLVNNYEEVGKELPPEMKYLGETLFLKGANSNYINLEDEILIKKQFPNSKLVTIAKAGHSLHAENPREFFETVKDFILK